MTFNKSSFNNESDYTKVLIKTFLQYSFFSSLSVQSKRNYFKAEPRIFPHEIKEQCWNNASKIPNRDPSRWRFDAVGNPVLKALRGCNGIFCHEYDHIFPFSKGGRSTLDNCQLLQTNVNRMKSNQFYSTDEMKNFKLKFPSKLYETTGSYEIGDFEMDLAEELIYGNINRI